MGLAGPRKRRKIGHDPNNTAWSRSSSGYGQKILSAQGWTTGSYLGAKDAPQSSHFSHANASHIRVLLKEDNLGLGAKGGQAEGNNFALSSLQDLYGRLNGKSDAQLQKEEHHRADVKRTLYADRKWGALRFVPGGVLVGDTIEPKLPEPSPWAIKPSTKAVISSDKEALEKRYEAAVSFDTMSAAHILANSHNMHDGSPNDECVNDKHARRESKRNKRRGDDDSEMTPASSHPAPGREVLEISERDSEIDTVSRAERKTRRRQRKLDRRATAAAVEEAQELRAKKSSAVAASSDSAQRIQSDEDEQSPQSTTEINGNETTQLMSRPASSRLAVRKRFIKQKRMASMDPQALREVFAALTPIKKPEGLLIMNSQILMLKS